MKSPIETTEDYMPKLVLYIQVNTGFAVLSHSSDHERHAKSRTPARNRSNSSSLDNKFYSLVPKNEVVRAMLGINHQMCRR
jgi:hypothetical protein